MERERGRRREREGREREGGRVAREGRERERDRVERERPSSMLYSGSEAVVWEMSDQSLKLQLHYIHVLYCVVQCVAVDTKRGGVCLQ